MHSRNQPQVRTVSRSWRATPNTIIPLSGTCCAASAFGKPVWAIHSQASEQRLNIVWSNDTGCCKYLVVRRDGADILWLDALSFISTYFQVQKVRSLSVFPNFHLLIRLNSGSGDHILILALMHLRRGCSHSAWVSYPIAPLLYFEDYHYGQHIFLQQCHFHG